MSKRESEKLGWTSSIPFPVFPDTGSILQDGETAVVLRLTDPFKSDL